ncbi:MAG: OmpA family protein [Bacteroidaceae bacterium]|nr:OmpA family protein [Bacteroidaceae bacterium]MBR5847638.1 OmpA family protein [Bacteroidaceae bacterium]
MKLKVFALSMCAALLLSSCGSWKNTGWGTSIGTVAGTAIGLGIGYWADRNGDSNTGKIIGASVGAAVGATTGALIGRKMDKAAEAAKQVEGAQVELVDVNGLPAVKVTFESGILFGFNSSELSDEAKASLTEFAEVLKATPDADVAILGHTDNVGTEKANQSVSEKRAKAVAKYLTEQEVAETQIKDVLGMSFNQPVASNDTEEGKAQNRRVEVFIYASQAMIDAANAEAAN